MNRKYRYKIANTFFLTLALIFASACELNVDDEDSGENPETLLGTEWRWFGGWGDRTIIFDEAATCLFRDDLTRYLGDNPGVDYDKDYVVKEYRDNWTYDPKTGRGNIWGGFSPGKFQLTEDKKTMHFISFSVYGHGADFTLYEGGEP
jgi:hypothetical protein